MIVFFKDKFLVLALLLPGHIIWFAFFFSLIIVEVNGREMCILFFYVNDHPEICPFKLIVASNRDELINRPTECAAFRRGKTTEWVGGVDLVPGLEGGSWLGISKSGKFAALLNILAEHRPKMKPRGHLVPDFLGNDTTCEEYMTTIDMKMGDFNGFQLLCIDLKEHPCHVHYISNKKKYQRRLLSAGIHSCCNSSDFDTPWQKRVAGQEKFSRIVLNEGLLTDREKLVTSLFCLLTDRTRHFPDDQLVKQFAEVGKHGHTEEVHYTSAIHMCTTEDKFVTRLNTTRLQDQLTEDQYSSLSTALDEIIAVLTTREDDGDVQPLDDQAPAGREMCILFFYVNDHPEICPFKLIVASNRDELINRPTECAAFRRGKTTEWVGGVDLVPGLEGGSWLGISKSGKFAALLNILAEHRPKMKPRGHLVPDFLGNDTTCEEYMTIIDMKMGDFNGFQLLCIDLKEHPCHVHYISNKKKYQRRLLSAGIHSCCNSSDFDTPWQKRVAGQEKFSKIVLNEGLLTDREKLLTSLFCLLNDRTRHFPDDQLVRQFAEVGKHKHTEEVHYTSAIHMCTTEDKFVTRTNTVILVGFDDICDFRERTIHSHHQCDNPEYSDVAYTFKIEPPMS